MNQACGASSNWSDLHSIFEWESGCLPLPYPLNCQLSMCNLIPDRSFKGEEGKRLRGEGGGGAASGAMLSNNNNV